METDRLLGSQTRKRAKTDKPKKRGRSSDVAQVVLAKEGPDGKRTATATLEEFF